jgi:hypothetical protein
MWQGRGTQIGSLFDTEQKNCGELKLFCFLFSWGRTLNFLWILLYCFVFVCVCFLVSLSQKGEKQNWIYFDWLPSTFEI